MTSKAPLLSKQKVEILTKAIQKELAQTGWQGQKDGAGQTLVQLFGHLAQVIIYRLNQVPRQHFRAFLDEAGIDRLPPRAASTELIFTPAPDSPPAIDVPQGTQVATRPGGTQPEVIFETERKVTVVPATLAHCIALDTLNYSDRTLTAAGLEAGGFPAFRGEIERERILYIGDEKLFIFGDDVSRQYASFTLQFVLEPPRTQDNDQWILQFLYWNGEKWADLREAGAKVAGDLQLRIDGKVTLSKLPPLTPTKIGDIESIWIACKLTGGKERQYLPVVRDLQISRDVVCPTNEPVPVAADAAMAGIQSGTVFVPLDLNGPVSPLGTRPTVLDAFYLRMDEAFTKPGATVRLKLEIEGVPTEPEDATEFNKLGIEWEYSSVDGWTPLGASVRGCPALATLFSGENEEVQKFGQPILRTHPLTRRKYLEFAIPEEKYDRELPSEFKAGTVISDIFTERKYVSIPVPEACASLPPDVLVHGGSSAKRCNFVDTTCALTTSGFVQFDVPALGGNRSDAGTQTPVDGHFAANTNGSSEEPPPAFAQTEVNGQVGYWIRARVTAGSYDVPQKASAGLLGQLRLTARPSLPPVSYPPVLKALQATYRNYSSRGRLEQVNRCQSMTDMRLRDHVPDLLAHQPFRPFTTAVEAPALYLGFTHLSSVTETPAFPGGQWLEIRFGVQEHQDEATRDCPDVVWEYWNGYRWETLHAKDGTLGLQRTGYFGFQAPLDHRSAEEFGHSAYWLRTRPTQAGATPYLEMISLNTVQAVNAETICDELLGSSNGEPGQRFVLARSPVLADLQIEVREPTERSDTTTEQSTTETRLASLAASAQPATTPTSPDNGVWTLWQPATSFRACQPNSRCFIFDPISGEIRFGDGVRSKIPPPGRENIHAKRYRTHQAAVGNVDRDTVTVVRNPKGDLGQIRSVTNLVAAAGGSAPEEVAQTEERGPYSLKSRQRAVTPEDFAWLAREVDGVARAQSLPTRDVQGLLRPGWVTVVITPQPTHALPETAEIKPTPTPILLRQVQEHLQEHALVNLAILDPPSMAGTHADRRQSDEDQITIKGPTYLEVTVHAKVVASMPEQSDAIRFAVIERLAEFLRPLKGGPERSGWEPGRDVYVSEIAAEIEQVPGVDHVTHISLQGTSRPQQWLTVDAQLVQWEMPAGSQVSTFDEQIRLILAKSLSKDEFDEGDSPMRIPVYGFNIGDRVNIMNGNAPASSFAQRSIAQLANARFVLTFCSPFVFPSLTSFDEWRQSPAVLIASEPSVRLPIEQYNTSTASTGEVSLLGVTVRSFVDGARPQIAIHGFDKGETVNLVASNQPTPLSAQLQIKSVGLAGYTLVFDKPLEFPDRTTFEDSKQSLVLVMSNDQRIRLPIELHHTSTDKTGKVSLLGVTARTLTKDDQVSLTHRDRRSYRVDLGPVLDVTTSAETQSVFVPADHLVCSGNHRIEIVPGG